MLPSMIASGEIEQFKICVKITLTVGAGIGSIVKDSI